MAGIQQALAELDEELNFQVTKFLSMSPWYQRKLFHWFLFTGLASLTGMVENQPLSWNLELFRTHKTHLQTETLTQKGFVAFIASGSFVGGECSKSQCFNFQMQTQPKNLREAFSKTGSMEIKMRKGHLLSHKDLGSKLLSLSHILCVTWGTFLSLLGPQFPHH